MRPLLSFGAHLTVADFLGRLSVNSDAILIGKFFGAVPLGLYTRASVLLARPLEQVFAPINAVMDPFLARLQSDPERYRRTFLRTFDALAMVVFPFAAICLALSKPLVLVILGPKWTGVVPLFSAFALVAISSPLSSVVSWLYQSQGRGQDQLRSHAAAGFVTVVAYVVGLIYGGLSGSSFHWRLRARQSGCRLFTTSLAEAVQFRRGTCGLPFSRNCRPGEQFILRRCWRAWLSRIRRQFCNYWSVLQSAYSWAAHCCCRSVAPAKVPFMFST